MRRLLLALCSTALLTPPAPDAQACAAAPVSVSGELGAGAQRIFISDRGDRTEVVLDMTVPETTEDYGVLIPVPVTPTLDRTPVNATELDDLDRATGPQIYDSRDQGGGGCGATDRALAGGMNVVVIDRVDIGPLDVAVLSSSSAGALGAWLTGNGYRIVPGREAALQRYTTGYLIAARRSDRAATGAASRIGLHFTLSGQQLVVPISALQLGADRPVPVAIWVAARDPLGPMAPYRALTLRDLDLEKDYKTALTEAVAAHQGRAFVLEGVFTGAAQGYLGPRLASLVEGGATLTRLTTLSRPSTFTADLALNAAGAPADVPNSIDIAPPESCTTSRGAGSLALWALLLGGVWRALRRGLGTAARSTSR